MRDVIHKALVTIGFCFWCVAMWMMTITTLFAIIGERVKPDATDGNCWSYALPKYHKHGGYLLVRAADRVKFLGYFQIPHVSWVRHLGSNSDLMYLDPLNREVGKWMPWHTIYYKGRVKTRETMHDAKD